METCTSGSQSRGAGLNISPAVTARTSQRAASARATPPADPVRRATARSLLRCRTPRVESRCDRRRQPRTTRADRRRTTGSRFQSWRPSAVRAVGRTDDECGRRRHARVPNGAYTPLELIVRRLGAGRPPGIVRSCMDDGRVVAATSRSGSVFNHASRSSPIASRVTGMTRVRMRSSIARNAARRVSARLSRAATTSRQYCPHAGPAERADPVDDFSRTRAAADQVPTVHDEIRRGHPEVARGPLRARSGCRERRRRRRCA